MIKLLKTMMVAPYKQRAHFFSSITMLGNFVLASVKLIVAIVFSSLFIGLGSFSTLCLGIAKWYYFRKEDKQQSLNGVFIILITFSFIYILSMILQIVFTYQINNIGLIPAIAVATATFIEIGIAAKGFIRSIKTETRSLTVLKSINLCSALTALVLTQSVLLAISSDNISHYLYDSLFGIAVGGICIVITLVLMISTIRRNDAIYTRT